MTKDTDQQGPRPLKLAQLSRTGGHAFDLSPGAAPLAAMAEALGIRALRDIRFAGEITAEGKRDWRLEARLTGHATQTCRVTLGPAPTRIDEPVLRRYLADYTEPEGDDVEMPEDDTAEPLPEMLDLTAVLTEAIALALPAFPRAEGADLGEAVFAAPGVTPLSDDAAKPLAGLAALRARMTDTDDGPDSAD